VPEKEKPRTQQRASITLGDLALSRDLPVVSIDMLDAIDWLAEAFGKEGYYLECAGDIARCSRAGSVIYCLADLELVHAHFPCVPHAGFIGGAMPVATRAGHATAAPPLSVMNCRRFMPGMPPLGLAPIAISGVDRRTCGRQTRR
jgi:hypothetical protein